MALTQTSPLHVVVFRSHLPPYSVGGNFRRAILAQGFCLLHFRATTKFEIVGGGKELQFLDFKRLGLFPISARQLSIA